MPAKALFLRSSQTMPGIPLSKSNNAPVILIVDDTEESRRLLEHQLKETAYELLFAKNGIEAIAAFKNTPNISLILMDMEMPVMDGYTAARTITSLIGKDTIPVIALTAHEGEAEIYKCIKAGGNGYLHKPITKEALMQTLSIHFNNSEVCFPPLSEGSSSHQHIVYIDPDLAALVPRFLENRRKDSEEISRLLEEDNLQDIRILGHSMAGSAGGYGFPELGMIGKAIEEAALASDKSAVSCLNLKLSDYLKNVVFKTDKVPSLK